MQGGWQGGFDKTVVPKCASVDVSLQGAYAIMLGGGRGEGVDKGPDPEIEIAVTGFLSLLPFTPSVASLCPSPSHSLSSSHSLSFPSHSLFLSLSLTRSRSRSRSLLLSRARSLSLPRARSLSHAHSCSVSLDLSLVHFLSLTHTHAQSLYTSLSLSHTLCVVYVCMSHSTNPCTHEPMYTRTVTRMHASGTAFSGRRGRVF